MTEPARSLPAPMTVSEFLTWNDDTDTRYELIDGRPVAMAPPSPLHSGVAGNVAGLLYARLEAPCRVHTEYGIWRSLESDRYFQADVAVVCAFIRRDEPPPEPTAIVEVVSPSSVNHDRGLKVDAYRHLESCRCILVVHSESRRVERWRRDGALWIVQDHIGEAGDVPVDGTSVTLDLAEIYEGVDV